MTGYSKGQLAEFYQMCQKARDQAYAPYSGHPVGAVVIDQAGRPYAGCNVEVAHFKGICAEGTAITQMILNGNQNIRDVFLIGPDERIICPPCGDCRQRIREFASPDIGIHCFGEGGEILKSFTLGELLPHAFGPENVPGRG